MASTLGSKPEGVCLNSVKVSRRKFTLFFISFVLLTVPFLSVISLAFAQPLLVRGWRSPYLPTGAWEGGFVIGDLNTSNPGEEIVYAGNDWVYVLDGRDGHVLWTFFEAALYGFAQPHLYDLDNDGTFEVVVPLFYTTPGNPGLLVLNWDGTKRWRWNASRRMSIMSSPVAGDVDGDGYLEIFIAGQGVESWSGQFGGQITKLSHTGEVLATSFAWRCCSGGLALADTDGDLEFEIYMGDRHTYNEDGAYGKGVRSFWASNLSQRWNHPDFLSSSQSPVLADVTGDGVLEVIVSNQRGGLAVLNSTTGKAIKKSSRISLPGSWPNMGLPAHYQLTVYDIDGDGHLEVLTADGSHPSLIWPDDEVVVFDLVTWSVDERIPTGTSFTPDSGQFGPTLADVTGDGNMEIIVCTDLGLSIFDRDYTLIFRDDWTSYGQYAIVQDIDDDGLVEVVVSSTGHYIYAWDSDTPRPAQRVRSEVKWYGEGRRGAAVFNPVPRRAGPRMSSKSQNNLEHDNQISGHEIVADVPLADPPLLVSSGGTNQTDEDLISYATNPGASNIFSWYVNDVSMSNLLLSFDIENPANTIDYSSYSNDGIVHGATWTSSGLLGGAYYFDGDDDYIKVLDGEIDDVVNFGYFNGYPFPGTLGGDGSWSEITVELSVYLQEDQDDVRFVAKIPSYEIGYSKYGSSGVQQGLFAGVWTQDGTDHTEDGYQGYTSIRYDDELDSGRWYHVAFTYEDGVGLALYLDGELVSFSSSPYGNIHCSSGEPLYIGWFDYFHGMMDDVRLYPRSLSEEQIYQRYLETSDGWTDQSILKSPETNEQEVWKCEVIQDGSRVFSNTLQVANNPPSAENLRVGPRQRYLAVESDDLIPIYDYSDPGGNPESGSEIRWYRNSILEPTLNDTHVVPASYTVAGDQWHFTVRPKDGVDFGDLQTSPSLPVLQNSPPTHSEPLLNSSEGTDGVDEDLTVIPQSTFDPDGNPVTNIYHWFQDGVSTTNLLMPFDTESWITLKDYSSYGNDGTLHGPVWIEEGVVGGAIKFDGDDFITIDDTATLGGYGTWSEITVEFWIKPQAEHRGARIIARKEVSETTGSFIVGFRTSIFNPTNTLFWGIDNGDWEEVYDTSMTVLDLNTWQHVVCTYKSGPGLTIYIDGTERANQPLTGTIQYDSKERLFIGSGGEADPSRYLNGILDEVRIYPKALSTSQVSQRYLESRDGLTSDSTIVAEETGIGEVWSCDVTPNDSFIDGLTETSNPITVLNLSDFEPPHIQILTPENNSIHSSVVPLTLTIDERTSWMGYNLDTEMNETIGGNTTLTGISEGVHMITVYANDTAGNMGYSDPIHFTVDTTPPDIINVAQDPPEGNVSPDDVVHVNATITDVTSGVKMVSLNYTSNGEMWIVIEMINIEGNVWNATIPSFSLDTNVTYVVIAEDNADNSVSTEDLGYEYEYQVIPEFQTLIILTSFALATLLVILSRRRSKHKKADSAHSSKS